MQGGPSGKRTARGPALFSFAATSLLVLWHGRLYARFLSDDALISLRYARRLVEGHGLTWTPGERVEGYTDFLWVLLTAAGGWMHCDYIATALSLDRIGVVLAVAAVGLSPTTAALSTPRLVVGGGLLAATIPMAVWANGGLEHGFMTGVLALGLALLVRAIVTGEPKRPWLVGVPFAMLALLRADGILLCALALAGAFLADVLGGGRSGAGRGRGRPAMRRALSVALLPICAVVGQVAFRRVYYGAWQPNTALAKLAFNRDRLWLGLEYARHGYRAISVMVAVAAMATVVLRDAARTALMACWSLILGWTGYVVVVGGDIFPGWRPFVFVIVPLGMLAAELAEHAADELKSRPRWAPWAAIAMTCVAVLAHYAVQRTDSENRRAGAELWEWDGLGVAGLLKTAFSTREPLLAVDAAGALPYWSELPSLDMLGLNDAYIARHPPPSFGHGQIGHELGDGAYVLQRAPDLVAFNGSTGFHEPLFLSGRQLVSTPAFLHDYQWVRVEPATGTRARGEIWVRREGGRIGVVRGPDRIDVPGYFVTGPRSDSVARLNERQSLTVDLTENRVGVLPELDMPAGCWNLTIDPPDAAGRAVSLRCDARSMQPSGALDTTIELQQGHAIDVAVAPALGSAWTTSIERLIFTRVLDCSRALRCLARGQRLGVPLASLSAPTPEHLPWEHPSTLVLGTEGVVVRIDERRNLRRIQIRADNDDTYALSLRRKGRVLWSGEIGPAYNGGGLALRTAYLAEDLLIERGDELVIVPLGGDGRYGLGQVLLDD